MTLIKPVASFIRVSIGERSTAISMPTAMAPKSKQDTKIKNQKHNEKHDIVSQPHQPSVTYQSPS
jgi:hypothetical protein